MMARARWLVPALVIGVAVGLVLASLGEPATRSWSDDPFPVAGWIIHIEPAGIGHCPTYLTHDDPDWTTRSSCDGYSTSFVDGVLTTQDLLADNDRVETTESPAAPNPWFSPTYSDVPLEGADGHQLFRRELIHGGADVVGLDRDGVPVLYVQRNESELEDIAWFWRDESGPLLPSDELLAAALSATGPSELPDAASLVSQPRRDGARRVIEAATAGM